MNLRGAVWSAFLGLVLSGSVAAGDAQELYQQALADLQAQHFARARMQLQYLQRTYPAFDKSATVLTRIAALDEASATPGSLAMFMDALTLRDLGQVEKAIETLEAISLDRPDGPLTDDALYISAYLMIMERYDFAAARQVLKTLQVRFPESGYSDAALYLDAIALEQTGDTEGARQQLTELRRRHTALELPMNVRWPRGSVMSRYWFDRAGRRLDIVERRLENASMLDSRQRRTDGKWRVGLSVNGEEMFLLLVPSPLLGQASWLSSDRTPVSPPSVGLFHGEVEGREGSWVRVMLENDEISGVVYIDGKRVRLQPVNLRGTLDYYQPQARKRHNELSRRSRLALSVQGLDALIAPPERDFDPQSRQRTVHSDIRSLPISIVVDSQYDRYFGGHGLSQALSSLNVADGLYRQFGLAFKLNEAVILDASDDPLELGSVTLETILRSFREYRLRYADTFGSSALSYLFSGNPKSDITLGLAWIDTACRSDGYDVGVITPSDFEDVLLTHELGHSLGAKHDSETQCNDDPLSLMWPNLSDRTKTQFSACSEQRILTSRDRLCLKNSVDLGLTGVPTESSMQFFVENRDSVVTVNAQVLIETGAPNQLHWPSNCGAVMATSATCQVQSLAPGEIRRLVIPVNEEFLRSDTPVSAQLTSPGLVELDSSDNRLNLSMTGIADVQAQNFQNPDSQLPDPDTETPSAGRASTTSGQGLGAFGFMIQTGIGLLLLFARRVHQ